jgi:hypothetical protein
MCDVCARCSLSGGGPRSPGRDAKQRPVEDGLTSSRGASGRIRRQRRAATSRPDRLWEHGVIPYDIDSNFSGEYNEIRGALSPGGARLES